MQNLNKIQSHYLLHDIVLRTYGSEETKEIQFSYIRDRVTVILPLLIPCAQF